MPRPGDKKSLYNQGPLFRKLTTPLRPHFARFFRYVKDTDIAVIKGVMGLYDSVNGVFIRFPVSRNPSIAVEAHLLTGPASKSTPLTYLVISAWSMPKGHTYPHLLQVKHCQ
jgi:hypothetical protein